MSGSLEAMRGTESIKSPSHSSTAQNVKDLKHMMTESSDHDSTRRTEKREMERQKMADRNRQRSEEKERKKLKQKNEEKIKKNKKEDTPKKGRHSSGYQDRKEGASTPKTRKKRKKKREKKQKPHDRTLLHNQTISPLFIHPHHRSGITYRRSTSSSLSASSSPSNRSRTMPVLARACFIPSPAGATTSAL